MVMKKISVLIDLHAAFDGNSGIPTATRLLLLNLSKNQSLSVAGFLQSPRRLHAELSDINSSGLKSAVNRRQTSTQLPLTEVGDKKPIKALKQLGLLFRVFSLTGACRIWKLTTVDMDSMEGIIWTNLLGKSIGEKERSNLAKVLSFYTIPSSWHFSHVMGIFGCLFRRNLYPKIDTRAFDIFVTETPYPGVISPKTAMVVRYHDAVPVSLTSTIKNSLYHRRAHLSALRSNISDGAWFICPSNTVRDELLSMFPSIENRIHTIHNSIAESYYEDSGAPSDAIDIIRRRATRKIIGARDGSQISEIVAPVSAGVTPLRYVLMVGTIEPRKNHLALLRSWGRISCEQLTKDWVLVLIGEPGWKMSEIISEAKRLHQSANVVHLQSLTMDEMRVMYTHAAVTVCPSVQEGFGYPGIEAMSCGSVVIASDTAVHREIYQNGALYFDLSLGYELDGLLKKLCFSPDYDAINELRANGRIVRSLYTSARANESWNLFLHRVRGESDHGNQMMQDTDQVWEKWGKKDPYFGVITDPKYRLGAIDEQARAEFFLSGEHHVAFVKGMISAHIRPNFNAQTVLDYGCGVGRTLVAFAKESTKVIGLDVSPSMLAEARRNCDAEGQSNIELALTGDKIQIDLTGVDLIHTYIVLQHIPVQRGVAILKSMIDGASVGAIFALHLTYSKILYDTYDGVSPIKSDSDKEFGQASAEASDSMEMQMNPYNLNQIFYLVQSRVTSRIHVEFTDHGGEYGVFMFFEKNK